jgi:Fic family protein
VLEQTQRGSLDVTPWVLWFLGCLTRAVHSAERELASVLTRARFLERLRDVSLNDRQRLMLNRLLEGFEGKLTSSKWATMTKTSQDSALRDIQQLVDLGVLVKDAAGGRSTSYSLAQFPDRS